MVNGSMRRGMVPYYFHRPGAHLAWLVAIAKQLEAADVVAHESRQLQAELRSASDDKPYRTANPGGGRIYFNLFELARHGQTRGWNVLAAVRPGGGAIRRAHGPCVAQGSGRAGHCHLPIRHTHKDGVV